MAHYFFILFTLLCQIATTLWVQKILWSYWDQPFQSDSYLELYHLNHLLFAKGWQVKLLNRDTVDYYLNKIPNYQNQVNRLYFPLIQHKADYIRLLLLTYFGGVWMDFTNIMTQDFSWLDAKQLKANPDVLNIYGQEPQVLFFTCPEYGSRQIYKDPKTQIQTQISPGYQIWFMASKKNSKFLTQTLANYKQALEEMTSSNKQEALNKVDKIIREQKIQIGNLNHYFLVQQFEQIILQRKQKQLDLNNDGNGTRQLAVNYFHIWHIDCEDGPFGIGAVQKRLVRDQKIYYYLKFDAQLLRDLGFKMRYFVKIIGIDRYLIKLHLVPDFANFGDSFNQMMKTLKQIPSHVPIERYLCAERYKIKENSIVDKYLLTNSFRSRVDYIQNNDPFEYKCQKLSKLIQYLISNQQTEHKLITKIRQQLQQTQSLQYSEQHRNKMQNIQNKLDILLLQLQLKQIDKDIDEAIASTSTGRTTGGTAGNGTEAFQSMDQQSLANFCRTKLARQWDELGRQGRSYYQLVKMILLLVIGLLLLFIFFALYYMHRTRQLFKKIKKIQQQHQEQVASKSRQAESQGLKQNSNTS